MRISDMAKITKCAQNECKESCTNGLRKPDCKECRKSGVCQIKKPAGKTAIREPINQLRKVFTEKFLIENYEVKYSLSLDQTENKLELGTGQKLNYDVPWECVLPNVSSNILRKFQKNVKNVSKNTVR